MAEKEIQVTAPSLVGRNLYLRPASPDDIANTQHWLLTSEPQCFSPHPVTVESAATAVESFKKSLGDPLSQTFVVVRKKDSQPVGRTWYAGLNLQNRSATVEILIDPTERRQGYGAEGLRLICGYLFDQRGLNRISSCAAKDNHAGVAVLEKAGFTQEGDLRQYYYYNGEYHDAVLFAMMRFEFGR